MDEAIQCDFITYIAYGKKLIEGPANEIAARSGLVTWRVEGRGLAKLEAELTGEAGVEQVARFGTALHVSGTDEKALAKTVRAHERKDLAWSRQPAGLEELFIHLMDSSRDNFASGA